MQNHDTENIPSLRELLKDEVFLTMKTWNGQLVSVPQSIAKEFQERQESLKKESKPPEKESCLSEKKAKKYFKYSIAISVVSLFLCIITGISCYKIAYKKGFKDNQPYSPDGSPTVYITPSGTKYHHKSCDYLGDSKISLSQKEAKDEGYTPCSKCTY